MKRYKPSSYGKETKSHRIQKVSENRGLPERPISPRHCLLPYRIQIQYIHTLTCPLCKIFLKISWGSTKAHIIKNENHPKSKPFPKVQYPKVNFWSNDKQLTSQGHSLSVRPPGEVHGFRRIAAILWNSKSYGLKVNLIPCQCKCYTYIEKSRQNNNTEAVNGITISPCRSILPLQF